MKGFYGVGEFLGGVKKLGELWGFLKGWGDFVGEG